MPLTRRRRFLFSLILLSFGGGLAVFLGEGLVRVFAPQPVVRPCWQNDPDVAFRGIAGCSYHDDWTPQFYSYDVALNNEGLRMPHDLSPTDTGLVLALGDSFLFGQGVAEAESFAGRLRKDIPGLVNAGWPAYGTGHAIKTLERLNTTYRSREVIYFCYFNDLYNNAVGDPNYRTHQVDTSGADIRLTPTLVYSEGKRRWHRWGIGDWLYKHSHLFVLVRRILGGDNGQPGFLRPRYDDQLPPEEIDYMEGVTLAYFRELARICQENDQRLLIVWMPCWRELTLANDTDWRNNFPFTAFKAAAAASAHANGYAFLDAAPLLDAALPDTGARVSTYYYGEGHYNARGHAWFFTAVTDTLQAWLR
ncbi:MAG: hypothetical protein KDC54_03460 [Lewinella sp.]|nr:hypothetical protein [Lewinella sp.]